MTGAIADETRGESDDRAARALREARNEAAVVVGIDIALIAGLPVMDKAKGWQILNLPWWAWLVLVTPALLLMALLLAVPYAELSPGRVRDLGVVLLGLLAVSDAFGVAGCSPLSRARRPEASAPATCSPT